MEAPMRDFELEAKEHEARAWLWETRCRELADQVMRAATFGGVTDHMEARTLLHMARNVRSKEQGK